MINYQQVGGKMGRIKRLTFLISIFLVGMIVPNAATCNYTERAVLNSEIANIKANYEIKERVLDSSEYSLPDSSLGTEEEETYVATTEYIQVNILNLTENVYIEVSNDVDSDVIVYNYSDTTDGNITFNWEELGTIITYTIKVYASSNTSCEGTSLKTIYLTLPRFNDYSEYALCALVPDYYLCERYVTYEEIEFNEFYESVTAEIAKTEEEEPATEEEQEWYEEVGDFITNYKVIFIVGGVCLVVAVGIAVAIIIRRRRRSIIWKS